MYRTIFWLKDWQCFNGTPFLAQPNNYAFMLNVDWFQPFKHSVYSVGVIYMVLLNLPRKERYKEENVIIVGVIPGPHEPKLNINTYLQPLVAELNLLWHEGIQVRPHGSRTARCFRAALLCIACDIPALRKVCGFLGCTAHRGCSKCKRFFPGAWIFQVSKMTIHQGQMKSIEERRRKYSMQQPLMSETKLKLQLEQDILNSYSCLTSIVLVTMLLILCTICF